MRNWSAFAPTPRSSPRNFRSGRSLWDKPLPRISICACSTGCFSTSPQADWLHWCLDAGPGLDLIIVPGTGILDDFNENPFGWPFAILRWSIAARLAGARFAFVSIGAGPVTHPLSRVFIRKAALLAAHRSYRDQVSYDFMRSLGVSGRRDGVSADIAFALPVADDVLTNSADQRIGLGVMNYRGWRKNAQDGAAIYQTYLNKMGILVDGLLDQGRQVRLLIGDQGDLAAVKDLQSRLRHRDKGNVTFEPPASLRNSCSR
ncbi:hypothetical protein HGG75_22785 [Ochrobactrum pseudogrignonense]|nr:hypothetical protein [Brucella pseudogrignonensis]